MMLNSRTAKTFFMESLAANNLSKPFLIIVGHEGEIE